VARNCDSKKWRHDVRYEIAYPPEAKGARRAPMLVLWQAQRAMRETRSRPRRVHLQVHRPCRGRTGEIPLSGHYVDGCDGWVPKTWSRAMSRKTGFLKGGVAGRRRQKDTSLARRSFLGLCSFITGVRETACHHPILCQRPGLSASYFLPRPRRRRRLGEPVLPGGSWANASRSERLIHQSRPRFTAGR
jgi:hypothetical protein